MIAVTNGTDFRSVSVDEMAGIGPYPVTEIDKITSIQSRNILNYAVGDFDADGNEEIVVNHWFGVFVFGLDQETLDIKMEQSFDVPRYFGYDNSLFTPVSMAAGDVTTMVSTRSSSQGDTTRTAGPATWSTPTSGSSMW